MIHRSPPPAIRARLYHFFAIFKYNLAISILGSLVATAARTPVKAGTPPAARIVLGISLALVTAGFALAVWLYHLLHSREYPIYIAHGISPFCISAVTYLLHLPIAALILLLAVVLL